MSESTTEATAEHHRADRDHGRDRRTHAPQGP